MEKMELLTVEELCKKTENLYKDLVHHINSLNTNIEIKNAAAYLRVSTDMQLDNSPEAQLTDILKYCMQNNYMLTKENIFLEPGVSGKTADKRIQFQKMMIKAESKPKPFDLIIVHKFDRFARNRTDSTYYKNKLRKRLNIDVVSVKEQLPEDKKTALLIESNLETMGEYYSLNLAEEVLKTQIILANEGKHFTKPAFGYDKIIDKVIKSKGKDKIIRKMVINEEEAKYVTIIFEKFANGETMRNICAYLNDLGIRTKNKSKFTGRGIVWILHNPVYIGKMRWTLGKMDRKWDNENTICNDSNHQPIISKELWESVQKRLQNENQVYGPKMKKYVKQEHYLRGLLKCDSCGASLVKNIKNFQCVNYTNGSCQISHSISVKRVEDTILKNLENDFTNKPININISKINESFDESELLLENLNQLEIKEKRIKLAYEDGIDSLEEYKENKNRLLKEKEKILEKINQTKSKKKRKQNDSEKVFKKCKSVFNLLNDPTIDNNTKTTICHELFEKIVFKKDEQKLVIYYKQQ